MLTTKQRDQALHDLYKNRRLLTFTNGWQWWYEEVNDVIRSWKPNISYIDMYCERLNWEAQHNYSMDDVDYIE